MIEVGSQVEGCVADNDLGRLYLGEEDVGIWRYGAEPDSGSSRTLVARVGENGLEADVEGLTIYYGSGSKGYLIASSQGNDSFKVYETRSNAPSWRPHRPEGRRPVRTSARPTAST